MSNSITVPKALKICFIIHFIADITFAIPLMLFPEYVLKFVGWQTIDPISARLSAAALFGIGIESLLCRNSEITVFKSMLSLKVIWSFAAILGIGLSILQGFQGRPIFSFMVLAIFIAFNILWIYWRIVVQKLLS